MIEASLFIMVKNIGISRIYLYYPIAWYGPFSCQINTKAVEWIAMTGSFIHSLSTITSQQTKIDFLSPLKRSHPCNLGNDGNWQKISSLHIVLSRLLWYGAGYSKGKEGMTWKEFTKTIHEVWMWLSVIFQTRLCVAMTMIVCHVAMTMIVCHLQQWLHQTNKDFSCLIILIVWIA